MTTTAKIPRIERGITNIYVPHGNKSIIFDYPAAVQNTYREVGAALLKNKQLALPMGNQTASLLHLAYEQM